MIWQIKLLNQERNNIGMDMDTGEMHFLIGDSETKIDEWE